MSTRKVKDLSTQGSRNPSLPDFRRKYRVFDNLIYGTSLEGYDSTLRVESYQVRLFMSDNKSVSIYNQ